ncbi:MAG: type II toxin-antitoxin system VapC family toxin [Acidobacteria bacterium]|nr:type II toxin-antitoxin system VapC family toxin [Acidobacteriota bacterium]
MKLLLDTHVWIWSLSAPEKLTPKVRRALEKPGQELWLSPVSAWEVALLVEKGRMKIEGHLEAWLPKAVARFQEAPVSRDIAAAFADIRLPHGDPADRLLLATARVLHLTLVTADERLIDARVVPTLPAL